METLVMNNLSWTKAAFVAFLLFGAVPLVGCEKDNSAGGVGKKLDNAIDQRGPLQKAGDKVDSLAK